MNTHVLVIIDTILLILILLAVFFGQFRGRV
jgi:hypothetical protein